MNSHPGRNYFEILVPSLIRMVRRKFRLFFIFLPLSYASMMRDWKGTHYTLKSLYSGIEFDDAGWTLDAPGEDKPALVAEWITMVWM